MNERGSSALEALPVLAVLAVFVGVILLGTYLIFTRAWLQYQSEQALYCLAEGHAFCRREFTNKLRTGLPFGDPGVVALSSNEDIWKAKVEWKIQGYRITATKELSARRLVRSKALRW